MHSHAQSSRHQLVTSHACCQTSQVNSPALQRVLLLLLLSLSMICRHPTACRSAAYSHVFDPRMPADAAVSSALLAESAVIVITASVGTLLLSSSVGFSLAPLSRCCASFIGILKPAMIGALPLQPPFGPDRQLTWCMPSTECTSRCTLAQNWSKAITCESPTHRKHEAVRSTSLGRACRFRPTHMRKAVLS